MSRRMRGSASCVQEARVAFHAPTHVAIPYSAVNSAMWHPLSLPSGDIFSTIGYAHELQCSCLSFAG